MKKSDWRKLTKEDLDRIRRNSDMGDPNVWKARTVCTDCANKIGGGCDILDWDEQLGAQGKGKCEFFEKKK